MKIENMSGEVVSTISDYYEKDGKEGVLLTRDILLYLYKNTTDDKLMQRIVEWMNSEGFCVECGTALEQYVTSEPHTELDPVEYEFKTWYDCPYCGDSRND